MTKALRNEKVRHIILSITIAFTCIVLLGFSKEIAESIRRGIRISVFTVIPSIFPFLVLSDYLATQLVRGNKLTFISRLYSIPKGSEGALLCGIICGFPCGVKYAKELYDGKAITKSELERLAGLVNTPSLAFVVSAVGMGMLNSLTDGFILFFSVAISVLLVSRLYPSKGNDFKKAAHNARQNFILAKSVKNAGLASLTISSYIIFFSGVIGIMQEILYNPFVFALTAAIFEIGNATAIITSLGFPKYLSFMLYGFALGFSGLSVHFQAFDVLPEDTSKKKYLVMKLSEGILCALIAAIAKTLIALI